jgi:hypothetical protein
MKLPENATDAQIEELNSWQSFVRDAMPDSWLSYAEELEEAAEVLWADSGKGVLIEGNTQVDGSFVAKKFSAFSRSYILLASLALENVLKGLIIAGDATLVSTGRLDKKLQTHKLIELSRKVDGLILSEDEQHILQVCQDAIPSWGRYPVPLEYKGLKPEEAANHEFRACFRRLHFRLCRSLYELVKDGWDSGVGANTLQMRSIRYGDTIDLKDELPWAKNDPD